MYRYGEEEVEAVAQAIRSGKWFRYPSGPNDGPTHAASLERDWASAFDTGHACLTSSGTAALMCCFAALQLGPGDEVIVPGYTFMATALAPLALGAIPVIVDIDETLTLDVNAVEQAITPRTKAICPVHMNGFMANMDEICRIAEKHNLAIIEDACQCVGGRWHDGRMAGTIGQMGAYSFNYYKTISCGEGGMFTTGEADLYERGMIYHDGGVYFRSHAQDIGIEFFAGLNLRGSEILAAMMEVQLTRLNGIIEDLHQNRQLVMNQVEETIQHIRCNGGTSTGSAAFLAFQLPNERIARNFVAIVNSSSAVEGLTAELPIDSSRHVYSDWKPVIGRRGAHAEAADPFQHPLNAQAPQYQRDMLPQTTKILQSTAVVRVDPEWKKGTCETVASIIRNAANSMEN